MYEFTTKPAVGNSAPAHSRPNVPLRILIPGVALFAVILVGGLMYAKWWPYASKTTDMLTGGAFGGTSSITGGAGSAPPVSLAAGWDFATTYFQAVWIALLAALLIASATEAFLPRHWLLRVMTAGPRWLRGSAAGGLLAMPTMMCTCCSAPVTVSLRRRGVPTSSALAYWIGNPILNPAVLVFMAVVLPWQWVGIRIAAGLVLVFCIPPLLARLTKQPTVPAPWSAEEESADQSTNVGSALGRFAKTFGKLSLMLVPEYIIVVVGVGAIRGWLFPASSHLAAWGVLGLIALAVAGALFVIPTAGEIPIIQGLLVAGLGAGLVGPLVITLPALSVPSLVMVGRSFPRRVLVAAFAAVVVLGVICGAVLGLWL